jgi:hypothetical protein
LIVRLLLAGDANDSLALRLQLDELLAHIMWLLIDPFIAGYDNTLQENTRQKHLRCVHMQEVNSELVSVERTKGEL